MKKPFLTEQDRLNMRLKTYLGAQANFRLELVKLKREVYKNHPCFKAYLLWRSFIKQKIQL